MNADAAIRADWSGSRSRSRSATLRLPRPGERSVVAVLALVAYLATALIVVVGAHSIIGDAWSRVANAFYVLFSRDPHLAAVGFVWNPLPSLAVMPLLPFKAIWPDLVATGFAGSIVSAICMAGAVWQVHGIAMDWHVRRSARLIVALSFALNPMIVYYGANGMSEAMFILTLVIVVRYLARWATSAETLPLVVAGVALAAAYMTRYEAVVAAIGAFGVVVLVSVVRRKGRIGERTGEGLADGAVLVTPFVTAFAGWAVASWLIVGDPFQQFTSVYGVVSQLVVAQSGVASVTGQGTSSAYVWVLRQLVGLEPGILLVGLLGLAATFRGRWGLTMPAVAVLGGVVAFAVFGFLTGRTLGWLRYSITVIPLASILALAVLAPNPGRAATPRAAALRSSKARSAGQLAAGLRTTGWQTAEADIEPEVESEPEPQARPRRRLASRLGTVVAKAMGLAAVALVVLAVPVGANTMLDPHENPDYGGEAFQLRPVLFPNEPMAAFTPFGQYEIGRQAAAYLDEMNLGGGTVLVDGAMGFPIILESHNPGQFITTPDRNFLPALLDPVSFGVRYLLVPEAIGYQSLDALNRNYPGIYETGAGIGQFVAQFSAGGNNWRLYQVVS